VDEQRVASVQAKYRSQVVEWSESADDPEHANSIFRSNHEFYKSVRDSTEGRAAISGLLGDPVEAVRLMAATHTLAWDELAAIDVLDDLRKRGNPSGVDAEYTLNSYRDGRLNLDW